MNAVVGLICELFTAISIFRWNTNRFCFVWMLLLADVGSLWGDCSLGTTPCSLGTTPCSLGVVLTDLQSLLIVNKSSLCVCLSLSLSYSPCVAYNCDSCPVAK
jgi:hypothetical protein